MAIEQDAENIRSSLCIQLWKYQTISTNKCVFVLKVILRQITEVTFKKSCVVSNQYFIVKKKTIFFKSSMQILISAAVIIVGNEHSVLEFKS